MLGKIKMRLCVLCIQLPSEASDSCSEGSAKLSEASDGSVLASAELSEPSERFAEGSADESEASESCFLASE